MGTMFFCFKYRRPYGSVYASTTFDEMNDETSFLSYTSRGCVHGSG